MDQIIFISEHRQEWLSFDLSKDDWIQLQIQSIPKDWVRALDPDSNKSCQLTLSQKARKLINAITD
jgi:hypothetical protein